MAESSQQHMFVVEQQQKYLKRHYRQSWVPLLNLNRGTLFWAALKHPRHAATYMRLYLVVAQGTFSNQDGSKGCMLAVAGLETNRGLGIEVYPESSRTWIRNVTLSSPRNRAKDAKSAKTANPASLEHSKEKDYDGGDDAPLYVEEGTSWEPRPNTIVDLSTLLVIEGSSELLCHPVGKLSPSSFERLNSIMDKLRGLPMHQYDDVMTGRTKRWGVTQVPGYDRWGPKAHVHGDSFDAGVNPAIISIFRPNDGVHYALSLDTILPREALRGQEWQY